jgi:hypothetical protein
VTGSASTAGNFTLTLVLLVADNFKLNGMLSYYYKMPVPLALALAVVVSSYVPVNHCTGTARASGTQAASASDTASLSGMPVMIHWQLVLVLVLSAFFLLLLLVLQCQCPGPVILVSTTCCHPGRGVTVSVQV